MCRNVKVSLSLCLYHNTSLCSLLVLFFIYIILKDGTNMELICQDYHVKSKFICLVFFVLEGKIICYVMLCNVPVFQVPFHLSAFQMCYKMYK